MSTNIPTTKIIILAADPLVRAGLVSSLDGDDDQIVVAHMAPDDFDDENAKIVDADVIVIDEGWSEEGNPGSNPGDEWQIPVLRLVDPGRLQNLAMIPHESVISRESKPSRIRIAINAVVSGWIVVDPIAVMPLARDAVGEYIGVLTTREHEVLELVAEGFTNRAISNKLGISENTVKFHLNAILTKLDAQSRTEAVVRAVRSGLLPL